MEISKNVMPQSVQKLYLAVRDHKLPHFMAVCIGQRMEICEISGLPIPMVPHLHQSNAHIKRKLHVWRVQNCNALVGAEIILKSVGAQTTPFYGGAVQGREWKYTKFRASQSPWYCVCTTAMVTLKGSYVYGELKNVMPWSVQKPYLAVQDRKLAHFMGSRIGSRIEFV